jgi:hypothetical protein
MIRCYRLSLRGHSCTVDVLSDGLIPVDAPVDMGLCNSSCFDVELATDENKGGSDSPRDHVFVIASMTIVVEDVLVDAVSEFSR